MKTRIDCVHKEGERIQNAKTRRRHVQPSSADYVSDLITMQVF
jgi:hypothetical protein